MIDFDDKGFFERKRHDRHAGTSTEPLPYDEAAIDACRSATPEGTRPKPSATAGRPRR